MMSERKTGMQSWKKVSLILLWLIAIFVAARWVDNWRINKQYAELIPPAAQQILTTQDALGIDVFALPDSAAASLVGNFLAPLVENIKAVKIRYIDSHENVELVKQYGIQKQGEMVVHQGAKNFQLSTLSYEAFFNGLKGFDQPKNKWIVFLENLSSHDFNSTSESVSGYGQWLNLLLAANYQAIVLNWQENMQLPEQAQLLVLAAPMENFTETQLLWLQQQIALGRSVLWLTDPQYVAQQPALSLLFDVMRTDGYHQGQLVIKNFTKHAINHNFDRPLDLFEVMPFETSNQPLWINEQGQSIAATQIIPKQVGTNEDSRIMVVGDSDFLSNQYLYSGGNLEMSYRLLDWLLHHDDRIDLPSIGVADTQIHLSNQEILWFAGIMLILLPIMLLVVAIFYWRKTR